VVPSSNGSPGTAWSLSLGCDCLGEIRYLDAVLSDESGTPQTITNAICMHEEDYGILWKHWNFRYAGAPEVRRSRRFVVSAIHTIGNYEHGFFWYLYLDGTIQFESKLTGIVQTRAIAPGTTPEFGTLVAPQLDAPNHQHMFNMRLDLEIDGPDNTVLEVDAVGLPMGPGNEHGNAIVARKTPITNERDARRACSPRRRATWPGAPSSPATTCGSPATTRRSCTRRATTRTSTPVTASAPGSGRNATSSTPTSCSGTRSAPRTCRDRRTGRSCRASTSGSR